MASINRLKPGQIVFSIERQRMGKTTIKRNFLFEVTIVGVNLEERYVMAS
jgi:hypothetical protein